jgi:hypothetical protein
MFGAVPFCQIFVFILPLRICLVRDRSVLRDFPIPTSGSQCYQFLRRTSLLLDSCSRRLVAFFLPKRAKVADGYPARHLHLTILFPPPGGPLLCCRSFSWPALDLARLLPAAAQSGSVFAFSRQVLFDLVVLVLAVSYSSTRFDMVYGCYFFSSIPLQFSHRPAVECASTAQEEITFPLVNTVISASTAPSDVLKFPVS